MKITTVLQGSNPVVCLDIKERLYNVCKSWELCKKRSFVKKTDIFNIPENFNRNFLGMSDVVKFLAVIEEFLITLINEREDGVLGNILMKTGTYKYVSPIYDCPLYFGTIQNSPEFWRRNKRDRVDLMFIDGFARSLGARTGHMNMVHIPSYTTSFRCATELGVVIGKEGKNIREEDAMGHVFGYTCVNDMIGNCWKEFAENRHPENNPSHFELLVNSYYGRCTENFGPVGPHIVTKDQVPDPYNLVFHTKLSGKVRDRAYSNAMLVGIERGIHLLSQFIPLKAGSIIHMGTMGCDGITINAHDPLSERDYIEIDIENVGVLRNHFVDHRFERGNN